MSQNKLFVLLVFIVACMPLQGSDGFKTEAENLKFLRNKIEVSRELRKDGTGWLVGLAIPVDVHIDPADGVSQNITDNSRNINIENALIFYKIEEGHQKKWLAAFAIDHNSLKNCELVFSIDQINVSYTVVVTFDVILEPSVKATYKVNILNFQRKEDMNNSTKALRKPHAN